MTSDDAVTVPASASIWYEGSVANAVASANANGSVLLVCLIQDATDDSESSQFAGRFTDTRVASELSAMSLVALKLIKDSPDGAMFGQIFPIMTVPALYVIRNGLLTDFMNSAVDVDQMLERIKKAVDGHFQIPPPPNAALSPSASASATSTPPAAPTSADNASPVFQSPQTMTSVAGNQSASDTSGPQANLTSATNVTLGAIGTVSEAGSSNTPTTSNIPPGADQSQVLKDLMKERKQKREKEEREAAKQREMDRRTSSKVFSEAQRELTEKQSKKLKDQIEKEKREEAAYKKRVKQALEEDKARRRAQREKALAEAAAVAAGNSPSQEEVLTPAEIRAQNSGLTQARNDAAPALAFDTSRLNIRLFDGSSIRRTFNAADTLQQVREWINENQDEENSAYNIVQLIPPHTFTDESKMLRDLELCPSATLVLKKITTASSAYSGSGDGAVPTLMGYGWSALGLAGKLASTAYSTVSYYNPLASTSSGGSSNSNSNSNADHTSRSASSKKKDRETSYNGNSTSLE